MVSELLEAGSSEANVADWNVERDRGRPGIQSA